MDDRPLVQQCRARKQDLWTKRTQHDPLWRDLAKFISPFSGRWTPTDKDRGGNKHEHIFDSTGTGALRTLESGMSSGLSNPNSMWMRLGSSDAELNKSHAVKAWLNDASERVLRVFRDSNTYSALTHYYSEMALFGTACGVIVEDNENVIHHHALTAGQYALAADDKGRINTMVREFSMTVAQMAAQFDEAKLSTQVRDQIKRKNWGAEFTVCHLVEPREMSKREHGKLDGKNMPWRSVYFEAGKGRDGTEVLQEGGYRVFPVVAPRWRVVGANVYGEPPAADAIGPVRRLQKMTLAEGEAVQFGAKPAMAVPEGLKGMEGVAPGEWVEIPAGQEVKEFFQPVTRIADLDVLLQRVQREIEARLFKPLFSVISDANIEMTATQVREIAGERLTQLGPTIMRADRELLAPLVDITIGHMFDKGLLPEPPPELEGMQIKPELIGVLAQAQKASGAQASDQLQQKVMAHAELDPGVRHLIDPEHDIREYADTIGADPRILRTPEKYREIIEAEAQAQAAQAQSQIMAEQAGAQKDVAAAEATAAGA